MEIRRDSRGRAVGLQWDSARPDTAESVLAERRWEQAERAIAAANAAVAAARAEADTAIAELQAEVEATRALVQRPLALADPQHVAFVVADIGAPRFELVTPEAVRFRGTDGNVTSWSAKDSWLCSCGETRERPKVKGTSVGADPGLILCVHVQAALERMSWRVLERMTCTARNAKPLKVRLPGPKPQSTHAR